MRQEPASRIPVLRLSTHLTFRGPVLLLLLPGPALPLLEPSVLGKPQSFSIASVSWSPMSHWAHRSFPVPPRFHLSPSFPVAGIIASGCSAVGRTPQSWTRETGVGGQSGHSLGPVESGVGGSGWPSGLSWEFLGGKSGISHHSQHRLGP